MYFVAKIKRKMDFSISKEEKKILLGNARESILAQLENRSPVYQLNDVDSFPNLKKNLGAFVTLSKIEGGKKTLRGCIGRMISDSPLIETIRMMAIEAAFGDPRFPKLKIDELSSIKIEISVLSPMVPCSNANLVKVGVHGLYLRKGMRSGVLLPQVPVEQGWNLQEYLDYICIKAGLPLGSYNSRDAELLTFTAEVFGEMDSST